MDSSAEKPHNPSYQELLSEAATEATKFIQKNPWAAIAGALVIGYLLGSKMGSSKQSHQEKESL